MKPKVKALRIRLRRVRRVVETMTVLIDVGLDTTEEEAKRRALEAAGMNNDKWSSCMYSIQEMPSVSQVTELFEGEA